MNIVDLPAGVLDYVFSHLSPSWLRSVRCTCRYLRSASLPLIRNLRATVPRDGVQHQLRALPHVTNFTLEVFDLTLTSVVANPLCSARLRHLSLTFLPTVSHCCLNGFSQHPQWECFEMGLKAATRLTGVTLSSCMGVLSRVVPACPQLRQLELLAVSYCSLEEECIQALAALRLASNLHTLRCNVYPSYAWEALLPELVHLPKMRSLSCVALEDEALLDDLAKLTQLTQLVVNSERLPERQSLAGLTRLTHIKNLVLRRGFQTDSPELAIALCKLSQLQRLCLPGLLDICILPALARLSCLTALELGDVIIDMMEAGTLLQPWTSRLQRLGLDLNVYGDPYAGELDGSPCKIIRGLGLALTNLEHLELRLWSLPAWRVLVPYFGLYTRLSTLLLQGPGELFRHPRAHMYQNWFAHEAGDNLQLRDLTFPALAHLSMLIRLTRLSLEGAVEARETATFIPALAAITNLQVLSRLLLDFRCAFNITLLSLVLRKISGRILVDCFTFQKASSHATNGTIHICA